MFQPADVTINQEHAHHDYRGRPAAEDLGEILGPMPFLRIRRRGSWLGAGRGKNHLLLWMDG